MTRHQFRNVLCILHSIDMHELEQAGVIARGDGAAWQRFSSNPERFFLRCDDQLADAIWSIIEQRNQPRTVTVAPGITRRMSP